MQSICLDLMASWSGEHALYLCDMDVLYAFIGSTMTQKIVCLLESLRNDREIHFQRMMFAILI